MEAFKFTELQEQWLQLLETTELGQAKGVLRLGDSYCCLGLAAEFVLGLTPVRVDRYDKTTVYEFDDMDRKLTAKGAAKLGLVSGGGSFSRNYPPPNTAWPSLDSLNDYGRYSFKEIAKLIRENPRSVFKEVLS